jgi:hypothetical protein
MTVPSRRCGFARYPNTVRHENLIDSLELGGEQTIEGVFQTDIGRATPLTHAEKHAPRIP